MTEFKKELEKLINQHHARDGSQTPDYILAEYLKNCLDVFNAAIILRDNHFRNRTFKPENKDYEQLEYNITPEMDEWMNAPMGKLKK